MELFKDLYEIKKENLIAGAEMFEADNQIILNEYLNGIISYKNFKNEAKLWPNNKTDYQPLLDFAKKNKIKFIATNIPRRYASYVFKKGLDSLKFIDKKAKKWIAPLPIKYVDTLKCYKEMLKMGGEHSNENLPKAQAIKDATMAYFILKNMKKNNTFLHFNGAYHSNNHQGIVWYIKNKKSKLKIITISTVEQLQIDSLKKENQKLSDFIIAVPESMCKTY